MTQPTSALIDSLAANATPVRRLAPAWRRTLAYLGFAALVLAALAALRGPRPDLAENLAAPPFVLALAGGLATGIAGTLAALLLAAPDRSRAWIALPIATATIWLGATGLGCLRPWVPIAPGMVTGAELANCFATVTLAGTPLTLAMLWMMRRAVPLNPGLPLTAAGLAAAGMTASALSVLHSILPSAMILVWTATILALAFLANGLARAIIARQERIFFL